MRRIEDLYASSRRPSIGGALGAFLPLLSLGIACAGSEPDSAPSAGTGGVPAAGFGGGAADAGGSGTGGDAGSGLGPSGTGGVPSTDAGDGAPSGSGGSTGSGAGASGASSGGAGRSTKPGNEPPIGPGPYAGMRPVPGTPASIGNIRIFDDIAGLTWNQTARELLFVVGQNNKIMRYRVGLPDASNFDVVRPGAEHMDGMKGLDFGPDGALWVCEARYSLPPRVSRSAGGYDRPLTVAITVRSRRAAKLWNLRRPGTSVCAGTGTLLH